MVTIGIVEDDRAINELLKRTLEKTGYRCVQAYTEKKRYNVLQMKQFNYYF